MDGIRMSEDRRKEIALMLAEQMVMDRGIPGGATLKQDLGNMAKKLDGVTTDELVELYSSFVPKMLGRVFGYQNVSLNMGNGVSSVNDDNT